MIQNDDGAAFGSIIMLDSITTNSGYIVVSNITQSVIDFNKYKIFACDLPRILQSTLPYGFKTAGGVLENWPQRLEFVPPRIDLGTIEGVTSEAYSKHIELWKKRVSHYNKVNNQLGTKRYRNLLDMLGSQKNTVYFDET